VTASSIATTSAGTHYSVASDGTFSATRTAKVSITGSVTSWGGGGSWTYSITASPVTIGVTGTHAPATGDFRALTGQQITATLNGTIGTVTSYTWSGLTSQTVFKSYDTSLATGQLVPLGTSDLTGPATGATGPPSVGFYDSAADNVTISCAAVLLAPDNVTTLNVTANAPQVTFLKPTATWSIDPSTLPMSGPIVNGQPTTVNVATHIGFNDNSNSTGSFGAVTVWYPVTITVPTPFSGGNGCFAQIVTPSATVTRVPTGTGAATYSIKIQKANGQWVSPGTGLDTGFPYPPGYTISNGTITGGATSSAFIVGGPGGSGDAPACAEAPDDVDNGGTNWVSATLNDQFTTWLMYQPPGGVWVPLKKTDWSVTGNGSGGPNNWTASGTYTAPNPADTSVFPQWNVVIANQNYRP